LHYFRAPQHFLNFFPLPHGQGSLRLLRGPRDNTDAVSGSIGSSDVVKCGAGGGGAGGSGVRRLAGFSLKEAHVRNSSIVSSIPVGMQRSSSL
jgi:hypothetical protein